LQTFSWGIDGNKRKRRRSEETKAYQLFGAVAGLSFSLKIQNNWKVLRFNAKNLR